MVTLPSDNVPLALIRYARGNSITEIVVGKSGMTGRAPFLRRRTIAEQIMKMSGDIDVAVVQEKGADLARPRVRLTSYLRAERASTAFRKSALDSTLVANRLPSSVEPAF